MPIPLTSRGGTWQARRECGHRLAWLAKVISDVEVKLDRWLLCWELFDDSLASLDWHQFGVIPWYPLSSQPGNGFLPASVKMSSSFLFWPEFGNRSDLFLRSGWPRFHNHSSWQEIKKPWWLMEFCQRKGKEIPLGSLFYDLLDRFCLWGHFSTHLIQFYGLVTIWLVSTIWLSF